MASVSCPLPRHSAHAAGLVFSIVSAVLCQAGGAASAARTPDPQTMRVLEFGLGETLEYPENALRPPVRYLAGGDLLSISRAMLCGAAVTQFRTQEAANAQLPESQKSQDLPEATKHRWPPVNITTLGGPSDFGWVETSGEAFFQAEAGTRTCAYVSSLTVDGLRFDQGSRQQAFFIATLESGSIKMAADIRYLPEQSMHLLCYAAPTPGNYLLRLRLLFTNTFNLVTCLAPENAAGYAGYSPIVMTWVKVISPRGSSFDLAESRSTLPLCSTELLAQTGNRGFWDGSTWHPEACRLTRLSQRDMLLCLSGKRVLIAGDSQVRIAFGLLQRFLNATSRDEFLQRYSGNPAWLGDFLSTLQITTNTTSNGTGPPLNDTDGLALRYHYGFLGSECTYYGGVYQGFSVQQVQTQVELDGGLSLPVEFNLTFSSLFGISLPLFDEWKLTGDLTKGAKVTDGGTPFDLVIVANQIHDSQKYDSASQYLRVMDRYFLPELTPLLENPGDFTLLGGLSAFEPRKGGTLFEGNNPRLVAFERATRQFIGSKGFSNFLDMSPVTIPRPDLAVDATHYGWQVSMSMLDLWLGSTCPVSGSAS